MHSYYPKTTEETSSFYKMNNYSNLFILLYYFRFQWLHIAIIALLQQHEFPEYDG
jgi:hypothetical protein